MIEEDMPMKPKDLDFRPNLNKEYVSHLGRDSELYRSGMNSPDLL